MKKLLPLLLLAACVTSCKSVPCTSVSLMREGDELILPALETYLENDQQLSPDRKAIRLQAIERRRKLTDDLEALCAQ